MAEPIATWPPTRPDYKKVMAAVENILRQQSISAPPVNPRSIAESYGLMLAEVFFSGAYTDVAGFIDFNERRIYINGDDPYNRKTFTIAHELGHYLLHREQLMAHPEAYRVLLRRPMASANDPLEKEANAFAAHLLVPRKFLDFYRSRSTVFDMARIFAVSEDVIRNRLGFEYGTAYSSDPAF